MFEIWCSSLLSVNKTVVPHSSVAQLRCLPACLLANVLLQHQQQRRLQEQDTQASGRHFLLDALSRSRDSPNSAQPSAAGLDEGWADTDYASKASKDVRSRVAGMLLRDRLAGLGHDSSECSER